MLVPRARLTRVGEELRAVAVEFFETAGRTVIDTLDRRLLGPEPILIVDSSSFSEQDVADVEGAASGRRRLYLVHPDQLDDASVHQLDRLRAHGSAIVPLSENTMAAAITDIRARAVLLELEREYGSDHNLFETRNSVIDERFRSGVSFLLAGGPMLAAYRNPDDLGSPPLNTAEPLFLGPLAEEEVAQLADHADRPVDTARLWADAAGHPQLLSGLLARVVDGRSYDNAVDSPLDVALRDFAVWHRQLGEAGRAFLRRLPDHGHRPTGAEPGQLAVGP